MENTATTKAGSQIKKEKAGFNWNYPEPAVIDRIEWGRDRNGRIKDRLPTKYRIEVATEPNKWKLVASSQNRKPFDKGKTTEPIYDFAGQPETEAEEGRVWLAKLKELEKKTETLSKTNKVYAGTFQQPVPTKIMYRGDPLAPREVVAPEGLSALKSLLKPLGMKPDAPERDRRVALAKWMTHPRNPLTARVMVNRIWHYHFGRGIVATPSNFGDMGFRPTHPGLLDWLAMEFMQNGWSVKHIHRLILNSKTYRQASLPRKDALDQGCRNRVALALPPPAPRGGGYSGQRSACWQEPSIGKCMGLAFCFSYPTPIMPATGSPKDEFEPKRHAPHGLHHAHPHGAGFRLRGLRLPRRWTGRPQPQPLDHPDSGPEPLQQRLHGRSFQTFRRTHRQGGRR